MYHQPISHSTITQSDLTINISCLSMSSFKGTLSRRFWRYGERFAWYVLKHVWNQSRCNGTSERVTSRTGSYKACPNEAVTSLLCLHKRSVWNCPCLIWCCLSVLNYSEMASKLLVCPRYLTLEGAGCVHCDVLPSWTLRSRLAFFHNEGAHLAFPGALVPLLPRLSGGYSPGVRK